MSLSLGDTSRNGIGFELQGPDRLVLRLFGAWRISDRLPTVDGVKAALADARTVHHVGFDTSGLASWDSALVSFLVGLRDLAVVQGIGFDTSGLPAGARRLVELAVAVPEKKDAGRQRGALPFLETVGVRALAQMKG
ncbi:MAG TPA: hypothetical protein VFO41_13675, partial [Alphaproteobacteria bacterium]|nr:hypothetical protein [Alphaproteobacteria bacterium]